ncbi:DNA-binding MarR family transcriptional regulator [Anseongella ginsenosidimutans]|uniref:DNA-binding MarR family transcriptional regulator n=1 Tax=Anseongella ginsenosidimutans TaxID=496056 RepID=A0A4R3KWK7_9SPHI|nr:winged helix DNA-binding protein [Anseongella ginsenosidimutans]QEC51151.1 winged helix DNA-binding protein [Anseongella ginsenosidimutans]TCS90177.1 DNA-binding MarR family transcriptional regulator [Anseongella ginsenosidimutans]
MKIEDIIRQKEFRNEQERAWINMVYTFNRLTDRITMVLKQFGITQQQYNVLRILRGRKGEVSCCSDVKEVMLDKNPDLTRLCDRLVAKGLIKRELNELNRREVGLSITAEGLALLEQIQPELEKHNSFLYNLSAKEAAQLSLLLDKLRE